jgi:glycosyltransferase involved in cell wall biosynthesis
VVTRRVDFSIFRHSFFGLNRIKYLYGIDLYIVVSRAVKDVLVRDGLPPGRIAVVRSGIDLDRFDRAPDAAFRSVFGISEGDRVVVNVAHFADHKGQRYLVEAAPLILRDLPRTVFLLIGEGELRLSLMTLARELGVADRVLFPGFLANVHEYLGSADLFVMPSHMEALGTAALEAMAAGLPVVASRVGGLPEIITAGRDGLLVPPRDPNALAHAVVRMLRDDGLRQRLASEGRKRVRAKFGVDRMVDETVKVYEWLLSRGPRGKKRLTSRGP